MEKFLEQVIRKKKIVVHRGLEPGLATKIELYLVVTLILVASPGSKPLRTLFFSRFRPDPKVFLSQLYDAEFHAEQYLYRCYYAQIP